MVFSGKKDVYIEVAEKYQNYIKLGVLKDGDKLPSVRSAANEFGINPNTMAKAYSLLEELGYITSVPKKGVYVTYSTESGTIPPKPDDSGFTQTVMAYKLNKIDKAKLIRLIEEVYNDDTY